MKPNLLFNGCEATTLDLPLDFFGHGKFQMIQLGDAPDRDDACQREKKVVTNQDRVKLPVRPAAASRRRHRIESAKMKHPQSRESSSLPHRSAHPKVCRQFYYHQPYDH